MSVYYAYDGQMITVLRNIIREQLTTYFGIDDSDLRIIRSTQPTSQAIGAVSGTKKYQVFIGLIPPGQTIGEGFENEYKDENTVEVTYYHIRQRVLQIECWCDYDVSDEDSLEGLDLAGIVHDLLTQQDTIEQIKAAGIKTQRCSAVRPVFTVNESEQYESTPSFDLTLTYNSQYKKDRPRVSSVTGNNNRV